jgi:hypothetical protein
MIRCAALRAGSEGTLGAGKVERRGSRQRDGTARSIVPILIDAAGTFPSKRWQTSRPGCRPGKAREKEQGGNFRPSPKQCVSFAAYSESPVSFRAQVARLFDD